MRILFAGTPEIAVPALDAVAASRHEIVGVLTAPDRARGRGRQVSVSPVKARAVELGLTVLQPERLRTEAREAVAALDPEALACFAYGRIFGPRFLALFPRGTLNVHPSLLPRHRGPAPIPAAILAGDPETGVSIQEMAVDMDAGDLFAQERIPLTGTETTESLTPVAATIGGRLLVEVLDAVERGEATRTAQDHARATYSRLVAKEDGRIDWTCPAVEIDRMIRAYTPWPRAFTDFRGERLVVHEAVVAPRAGERANATGGSRTGGDVTADPTPGRVAGVDTAIGILVETGNGQLALRKLQLPSRKPLDWSSFLNGVRDFVGAVLGGS